MSLVGGQRIEERQIEAIEYHGRHMSFDGGGKEHIIGGEGPIMARNFDVKEGDVVFDVGAADSSGTLYALASGAKLVYSFEPQVQWYKKLIQDLMVNPGFFERCRPFLLGLDQRDCVKSVVDSYTESGGAPTEGVTPEMEVPVRFIPMDFFLPELDRLDWVKMDIEGFEWNAMLGGKQLIEKFRPNFLIENHQYVSERIGKWMRKENVINQMYAYLLDLGYKIREDTHYQCLGRSFIVATRRP